MNFLNEHIVQPVEHAAQNVFNNVAHPQQAAATQPGGGDQPSAFENLLRFVGVHHAPAQSQSPEQVQAQMLGSGYAGLSPAQKTHLDRQAQARGYPSYAAMRMKQIQYQKGSSATGGGTFGGGGSMSGQDMLDNAMAIHPAKLLEHVNQAYADATGQDPGQ